MHKTCDCVCARVVVMPSILAEVKLDVENFEGAIAIGMKSAEILTMFDVSKAEMDKWCLEQYGKKFDVVYAIIKQCTYKEFLDTVRTLGFRGNPSALNIINQAINDKSQNSVVKIVFDNNVPTEEEEEKENDE